MAPPPDPVTWTHIGDGTAVLTADGAVWWRLLESASEANAAQALAFLEAAHALFPWTAVRLWEPLFDPLAHVEGLADTWRSTTEPLHSALGWGLARSGRLPIHALPVGVLGRVAAELVQSEDRPSLASDLARAEAVWPDGQLRRALLDAALAADGPLPATLVHHLIAPHGSAARPSASATPSERVRLRLRATSAEAEDALGTPLPRLDPEEHEALRALVDGWATGAITPPDAVSRFRACELLLEREELDARHDPLLPVEMFTWAADLAAPGCGLCASESDAADIELPLRVVRLLARLPRERREVVLLRAERAGVLRAARWLRDWLDHEHQGPDLDDLPAPMRDALALASSRLVSAPDGHLPRLLQREVRAAWGPTPAILGVETAIRACAARPELARRLEAEGGFLVVDPLHPVGDEARIHAEARMRRLVELRAPLPVIFAQAHGLRHAQAQPDAGWAAVRHAPSDRDAITGWRRAISLALHVTRRLGSSDPRVDLVIASLERARAGDLDGEGSSAIDAADALEAAWEASPHDAAAAAGHHAACALDEALQLGRRTDQDDRDDIAERAFVLARAAEPAAVATDDPRLVVERRAWWSWWLLEAAPSAYRSVEGPPP